MTPFEDEWHLDHSESLFQYRNSFLNSDCSCDNIYDLFPLNFHQEQYLPHLALDDQQDSMVQNLDFSTKMLDRPVSDLNVAPESPQKTKQKKEPKPRKRKTIKPSPYHNFQKHLNSTMKQILEVPPLSQSSPTYHRLAIELWQKFKGSETNTKKILHFIFNEFNEYLISERQLQILGFEEIYKVNNRKDLSLAKNFLTELALEQLTSDNIDDYLQTRRIKKPQKFKQYLMQFVKELQDGFIKKRFTNRSKKQQIKLMLAQQP